MLHTRARAPTIQKTCTEGEASRAIGAEPDEYFSKLVSILSPPWELMDRVRLMCVAICWILDRGTHGRHDCGTRSSVPR